MKGYVKPSYSIIQLRVEERIAGSQCSDKDQGPGGGRPGGGRPGGGGPGGGGPGGGGPGGGRPGGGGRGGH